MEKEEKAWLVQLVKERNEDLTLTDEQAEQIHFYEEYIENGDTDNFISSPWENLEVQKVFYKSILNEDQFEIYLQSYQYYLKAIEEDAKRNDAKQEEIYFKQELLEFYKQEVHPIFLAHRLGNKMGFREVVLQKRITLLKEDYKDFLQQKLRRTYAEHIRYHKSFQPNQLKVSLLDLELIKVYPNYTLFESKSDEYIQAIADSLFKEMMGLVELVFKEFYHDWQKIIDKKTQELREKYLSSTPEERGWTFVIETDEKEEEYIRNRFLSYLLIDENQYQF